MENSHFATNKVAFTTADEDAPHEPGHEGNDTWQLENQGLVRTIVRVGGFELGHHCKGMGA
jgi:hypothetical protein